MKIIRKLLIVLGVCLIIGSLISCNNKVNQKAEIKSRSSANSKKKETVSSKKKIALVMKTLTNPFFVEMEKGARKAENEFGINLIVKSGAKETSIEQQIAIVEELIVNKVDAIVIAPGSSTDLIPVLKKAQDEGIVIVNIDNRLDRDYSQKIGLKNVPFISVDNEEGGYLSAKELSKKISKKTNAVILEGIRGADNAEQRKKGALRAFKENSNINVVASETANWKIDEAFNVLAGLYTKFNDIEAVFCANDMMALGALECIQKLNKSNVTIAGFDALEEVKKSVKDGKILATIDQRADLQGYTGVKYAMNLISGKKVKLETFIDVKLVTPKNVK